MGVFDDIIQKYGQPQGNVPAAQARFSRAPISFVKMPAKTDVPPRGSYNTRSKNIQVAATPNTSFEQMQSIVRHEDAHATLDSVGRSRTALPPSLHGIPGNAVDLLYPSAPKSLDVWWDVSGRVGDFDTEIPAYLTAYRPGEIKGITSSDAQRWLEMYSKTLPADTQNKILRLGEISRSQTGK